MNTKHLIPEEVKYTVLTTLRHVFTITTNKYKRCTTNIKFEAEMEEKLYNDEQLQSKGTLERFLFLCEAPVSIGIRGHEEKGG
jgi:hypothetical protein